MNVDYHYLVGHLQNALAKDPRVSMLDVKIMICNGKIHLTGQVNSELRRHTVEDVVRELAPESEIRNELTLLELTQPVRAEVISE